tara:strand:+ start:189 stop:572 length:384 start_codon:yes stop_codon:yes gene_type:complete
MKQQETTYKSYEDFHRKCFPNSILERLDITLCSYLGLDEEYQHSMRKSDKNSNAGTLEFAKSAGYFEKDRSRTVEDVIKRFYQNEGFQVSKWGLINVKREKEQYQIMVTEQSKSWVVNVWENKDTWK